MASILFSVVIPTCDRPDLVCMAIGSVLRQTHELFEIIVVDNGTFPLDQAILPVDPRVRLVRALPRFGVAQARNLGAILAKGTHVSFLDDDDIWEDNYLKEVASVFVNEGVDIVLGARKEQGKGIVHNKSVAIENQTFFLELLFIRNPGATGSVASFTKEAFMSTKGYDPYLVPAEDKALIVDMMLKGFQVARAEKAVMIFIGTSTADRLNTKRNVMRAKPRFLRKYWKVMPWKLRVEFISNLFRNYMRGIFIK